MKDCCAKCSVTWMFGQQLWLLCPRCSGPLERYAGQIQYIIWLEDWEQH